MLSHSQDFIGQALGTCTLKHLVGRGGMGAVYLAQQSRPRRTVAVKVLLPNLVEDHPREEFLTRFRREADAIAALDHINIMPIYEYGEQEDIAYLVMPYITGGTLRERLEKRTIPPLEETVQIIEEASAGLDAAHAQGIIHRDLKPGNILFHADGRVVLADFGLAKVLKETAEDSGVSVLTSTGTIIGTPEYLSPEQGSGETLDYRTDVYSLGVVLYQMLAGRVPFVGPSPVAVAIKHTLEPPPPITRFNAQVPRAVEAVVMKALSKKPEERFNSAGEMARALRLAVMPEEGTRIWQAPSTRRLPSVPPPLARAPKLELSTADLAPADEHVGQKIELDVDEARDPQPVTTGDIEGSETPRAHSFKEQVTTLPTVLMNAGHAETESVQEEEDPHAALTEEAPHLPPREGRNREGPLPSLPTLITQADPTVADAPSPRNFFDAVEQRVPQQHSPTRPRDPEPVPPKNPAEPVMEKRVLADQHRVTVPPIEPVQPVAPVQVQTRPYPPRGPQTTGGKQPSMRMALVGVLLALVVIVGGVIMFTQYHPQNKQQINDKTPPATQQQVHATGTPGNNATPTQPGTQLGSLPALPSNVSHGQILYGSANPTCNPADGKWSNPGNVTTTCTNNGTQIVNNGGSSYTGTFLDTPPQGESIPDDFVLQVQVTINSGSSNGFGIFYRSQPNAHQQAYAFMIEGQAWTDYVYNTNTNQYDCLNCHPVPITHSLSGTFTIIIIANSNTFGFYVNGQDFTDPGAESGGQFPSGTIGFAVNPGANVTFKNLAVYAAS